MLEITEIGGALLPTKPGCSPPRHTELPQATPSPETIPPVPAANPLGGQIDDETRKPFAAQLTSDEGHKPHANLFSVALVGNLAMETRRFNDLRRARQRLDLQIKAMCRYACDGDTKAGQKLCAEIVGGPKSELAVNVAGMAMPYFAAMEPLDTAIAQMKKTIRGMARQLPIVTWVKSQAGVGTSFLGRIVGECGAPVGEFKSVSAVWKRMGLAVINGERQRRVLGDAAIEHGYVARRRALMWNVGESIIKQQLRSEKDEAGKKIVGTDYAIGELGQIYLDRKAYELTKTDRPIIAHNRAKRYMEKRLLREMWKAWRREDGQGD